MLLKNQSRCCACLDEWKALLADESVLSLDRSKDVPLNHSAAGPLDETFHRVIGAAGFAYPEAIKRFLTKEKESQEGGGSKSNSSESSTSKVSWEETVREMASGGDALSFRDIPFHQAAKSDYPSYSAYVQFVLRNCHSRRIIITDSGYVGLAPEEVEVGNLVYICVGAAIPFVLRKVQGESEQFQLVGECYVEDKARSDLKRRSDVPQYIDIV
jgi:hypothetical protein